MELKKAKKADLEWRKPAFVQIGLVIALLVVFLAFEFVGAKEKDVMGERFDGNYVETDIIIPTVIEKPLPLPPLTTSLDIRIVPDDDIVADLTIDANSYEGLNVPEVIVVIEEDTEVPDEVEPAIRVVEIFPEYPGGDAARVKFLQDNLVYPRMAREIGLEGKVWVGFVVEKDGSLSNFSIAKGVAPVLDDEALRVVKMMPKWTPGKQRSKPVRVQYQIPISFSLTK